MKDKRRRTECVTWHLRLLKVFSPTAPRLTRLPLLTLLLSLLDPLALSKLLSLRIREVSDPDSRRDALELSDPDSLLDALELP